MMWRHRLVFFGVCFGLSQLQCNTPDKEKKAVTYNLGGGRFGDKLVGYAHAKWISYKYGIPLLFRPFINSDKLMLHYEDDFYENDDNFRKIIQPNPGDVIDYNDNTSTLYIIPYFPETPDEHQNGTGSYYYFPVDWEDKGFKQELKRLIQPLEIEGALDLPKDRFLVALHVRDGGNTDLKGVTTVDFPLKFPPISYYIEQIGVIYKILGEQPLYVHLFTDANDPVRILNVLRKHLSGKNIMLNCRRKNNDDTSNVLEDFFAITRFDGLIRPESNYSIMASKIGDFKLIIKPIRKSRSSRHIEEVEVEFFQKDGSKKNYQLSRDNEWSGLGDIMVDFDN